MIRTELVVEPYDIIKFVYEKTNMEWNDCCKLLEHGPVSLFPNSEVNVYDVDIFECIEYKNENKMMLNVLELLLEEANNNKLYTMTLDINSNISCPDNLPDQIKQKIYELNDYYFESIDIITIWFSYKDKPGTTAIADTKTLKQKIEVIQQAITIFNYIIDFMKENKVKKMVITK